MGHRSITLLLCSFLALAATKASALGLGEITLDSALNEPLRAEIELFETRDLNETEIKIGIAPREDFERIGVDRVFFLSEIKFETVLGSKPKIIVTSNKPVREPFLNFLVQVQWPSGRLLREYTLLMDLPAFTQQAAPAVQGQTQPPSQTAAAPQQQAAPTYKPRSTYDQAPPRPSGQQQPVVPKYTGDTYSVKRNDTLWEIASSIRPDANVSIHQVMLALQRENPEAFINNNINLVKAGQILRIPDREAMASLSRRDAVAEVAVQNAEWSGGDVSRAQLSGTDVYNETSRSSSTREGRVKLSSPDDAYDSTEGRSSGSAAASSTDALENELAITLEQLDKTRRENSDLRSKVSSLEEQIATMERLLEVSSESLRQLELSASQSNEASGDDSSLATIEDGLPSSSDTLTDDAVEPSPEATPEATATPSPKKVVIEPPKPEKGIVDILLENIIFIAIGIVAIGAGVFFLLRRKSHEEDEADDFLNQYADVDDAQDDFSAPPLEDDDVDLGDIGDFEEPEPEAPEEEYEPEPEASAQTEDVVAEADIYIAYGKLDQAEEMLLKALNEDESDENIRLKLLEVYATQGDIDNFDPQYAKLRAQGSAAAVERADSLRSNIPNAAPYEEEGADDEGYDSGLDLDLESDLGDLDSDGDPDADLDLALSDDDGGLGLDDDLSASTEEDGGLDLDLDLGDLEGDSSSDDDDFGDLDLDFDSSASDGEGGSDLDNADDFSIDFDSSDDDSSDDDLSSDLDFDLEDSTGDEIGSKASGLSLDSDDMDLGELSLDDDDEETAIRPRPDELTPNESESDFDLGDLDASFDVSDDAGAPSDTTVNEALNEEYIEQKLSEAPDAELALDDALPLEAESGSMTQAMDSLDLDDDDDLDLSSLDKELDALTGDVDLGEPDSGLDEPMTDFDDFDDDLEKDLGSASSNKDLGKELDDMGEDTMFDQAISEVPKADDKDLEFELPEVSAEDSDDDDLDFLSDSDETATKLDLARAYIDMGDQEGARDIIKEVMGEGTPQQKSEAEGLLARIDT